MILRPAAFALLFLLEGCATTLPLAMPTVVHVRVLGSDKSRVLQPPDPDYRRFQAWITANRTGWSHVYATNPNRGISVAIANMDLQFVDGTVFTLVAKGMFSKSVKESEYAFLIK